MKLILEKGGSHGLHTRHPRPATAKLPYLPVSHRETGGNNRAV